MTIRNILPKSELLVILILFVVLKIPTMNVPYFGDETIAMSQVLETAKNKLSPILSLQYDVGHPPFFYLTGALFYLFFGESPIVSRIYSLIFSLITVYFTYLLGDKLIGRTGGIIASVLLVFSPIFFSQSGIFLLDVPLTALTVATLYFALNHDTKKYLIAGSILVLTKEPAIITILSILIYTLIENIKLNKKQLSKKLFIMSIPIFVFLFWLAYHYLAKGWFFYQPWFTYFSLFPYKTHDVSVRMIKLKWVFFDQFRFIGIILIIVTIFSRKYRLIFNKETIPLWFNIVGYIFLFSCFDFFSPRYYLPAFPALFILFSIPLSQLNKNIRFLLVLIIALLFFMQWFGDTITSEEQNVESNMEYLDMIRVYKLAIDYLSQNYPLDTSIVADCPMYDYLTNPSLHYLDTPFSNVIRFCNTNDSTDYVISKAKLFILAYQGSNFYDLQEKINHLNLTLIKRYKIEEIIIEIYENNI